jgi:hypothetical protein
MASAHGAILSVMATRVIESLTLPWKRVGAPRAAAAAGWVTLGADFLRYPGSSASSAR